MAGNFLGNLDERAIKMRGDGLARPSRPFEVLPLFAYMVHRSSFETAADRVPSAGICILDRRA